jgi:hypothetical protein
MADDTAIHLKHYETTYFNNPDTAEYKT